MRGEKLLSLTQAAKWLEEELGVVRNRATIFAWCYYGRQGTKLECVSVAGKWFTSREAVKRFIAECTRRHSAEAGCDAAELTL